MGLTLLCLGGCGGAEPIDPVGYAEALRAVSTDPSAGASACAALVRAAERGDCIVAAAEALAATDTDAAQALCDSLVGDELGLYRDECGFQVAERSGDPERCATAGRFADDCRLHQLSSALGGAIPRGAAPGGFESQLAPQLAQWGFAEDDLRPWSAAYRWVLGGQRPLDLGSCAAVARPELAEACVRTGLAHYEDVLNHARDTGSFPCDGSALTGRLAHMPHPELDALIERRRQEDLCPE